VKQGRIRQLYESEARGIYDDDLIEEVDYALLFRCESFVAANTAVRYGQLACVSCGGTVERSRDEGPSPGVSEPD
jgi:hypothetical protein